MYPQKSKVNIAAKSKVRMNLNSKHLTTLGFGQLCPVYFSECVPGDHFSITPKFLAQVAPLYRPTFGDVTVNLRAFFVPHRIVWPVFEDFINQNPHLVAPNRPIYAIEVPYIQPTDVIAFLTDPAYCVTKTEVTDGSTNNNYDVIICQFQNDGSKKRFYIKLNQKGRFWLKVFEMLGYNFALSSSQDVDHSSDFSALPLLAFMRIFLDWYTPSQFQASNPIHGVINFLQNETGQHGYHITYTSSDAGLPSLKVLFESFEMAVENDYFTSAWETPNSPSGTSSFENDVAYRESSLVNRENRVSSDSQNVSLKIYQDNGSISGVYSFSAFALDMLEKLRNFVTRNHLAGSRPVERILARFGVRVPDSVLRISEYIGSVQAPLDIYQVVNQGGELSDLGYQAGRALVSNSSDKSFDYDVKEYGYIFVCASLQVHSTFVDGYNRALKHLSPFDFYTPEFDGMTPQAIDSKELFNRAYGLKDDQQQQDFDNLVNRREGNGVFGFSSRYAEYKFGRDNLTGDFLRHRFAASVQDFELLRRVTKDVTDFDKGFYFNSNRVLSPSVVVYQSDVQQFNRIFNVTSDTPDPFYFIFNFIVSANRPMLPVNDQAELDGFKDIELETNGTKMS